MIVAATAAGAGAAASVHPTDNSHAPGYSMPNASGWGVPTFATPSLSALSP